MDKMPERKCKCGVAVTRDNGVIHYDSTPECHECGLTWHYVATRGIDPWTARAYARKVLA